MAIPALPGALGSPLGVGATSAPIGGWQPHATAASAPYVAPHLNLPGQNPATNFPLNFNSVSQPVRSVPLPATPTPPVMTASPAPASPHPSASPGTVAGTVLDSITGNPVSGAQVEFSPLGSRCPVANCSPVLTDHNGRFTFTTSAGFNVIYVTNSYYAQNSTYVDVQAGTTTNVGIIYLVHDGYVSGTIENLAHQPVADMNVSSGSVNGSEFAFPTLVTGSAGTFTNLPVLPVPSLVSWSSTFLFSRYQGNFTWVDVRPYQSVNLGILYVEAGILVHAELVSSTTHKGLLDTAGGASGKACSTYLGCSYQQGQWVPQAGANTATVVTFDAVAGPNQVTFQADDYVENITQVTFPQIPPNQFYNMGTVYLVPEAAIEATVDLTWASQAAKAYAEWDTNEGGTRVMFVVSYTSIDGVDLGATIMRPNGALNTTATNTNNACGYVGDTVILGVTPLRDAVNVHPDTGGVCNGMYPTWDTTYTLPVFDNNTYANTTPDEVTNIGYLNLTPGVFITGTVTGNPTAWGVQACTTDEVGAQLTTCGEAVEASDTAAHNPFLGTYYPYDPPGCVSGDWVFCVPAPVGPDELRFTAEYAVQNQTWAYVTPGVFPNTLIPLKQVTGDQVSSVHLLQTSIKGRVLDAATGLPVAGLVGVTSRPAGGAVYPTSSGAVNYSGSFFLNNTPGWDAITVTAPLYEPNTTWAEVNRSTENVGTINLTEDGYIHGFVVDPQGKGIQLATVYYCSIAAPDSCTQLGLTGLTSTYGEYFGQVAPGLLPLGSYRVVASAAGYDENSTWVNVTAPNTEFNASVLVLHPAGNSSVPSPHLAGALGPRPRVASSVWVNGQVIDNSSKIGLTSGVSVQATSTTGAIVDVLRFNTAGDYNISLTPGAWFINATSPQYFYAASVFVNVSVNGATQVAPLLALDPLPWVQGRLFIQPWESITTLDGMGPGQATVRTCATTGLCGDTGEVNSAGFYYETAPFGQYDRISAGGTGTSTGQPAGGFITNSSVVQTVSNATLNETPYIGLGAFGTVLGLIRDASTGNESPVRYANAEVYAVGPGGTPVTVTEVANSGGEYIAFLPQNNKTTVRSSGEAFEQGTAHDSGFTAGGINVENNTSLVHFGWVVLTVNDSSGVGAGDGVGRGRIGLAQVSANTTSVFTNASYSYANVADSYGFDNISAPPGSKVTVNVQAPDYTSVALTLSVNESETTYYNDTSANPYTGLGVVTLTGWSWLTGHVVDPARGNLSLPGASVTITNVTGVNNDGPVASNFAGNFLSDVPLGHAVNVSVSLPGYSLNKTNYTIVKGITGNLAPVNLTGMGVVAGYVFGYPTYAPVAGALISICLKGNPSCSTPIATTNGSGDFWTIAPAGLDALNVTDTNYVPSEPSYIKVKPDSWNWIGAINLSEYAFIYGTVRGLPSGDLISNANISLCFPSLFGGSPIGGCLTTVTSDANGRFFLPAASGTYVIDANATNYNDTYLPLSLSSGEYVNVNTIFLQEYGFETGRVLGADTQAPIPGTTIQACPAWEPGQCNPGPAVGPTGAFSLSGAPGPYTLFAIAPGYQAAYLQTVFLSGVTVQLPPIYLLPTGTNLLYSVSGTVSSTTGFPVQGAIVSAGASFATATDQNGSFALSLPWGTYTLQADAPGYLAASTTVVVHSNVPSVNLTLAPSTFVLSGVVRDGLTAQPLQGVTLSENIAGVATTIAQTDATGAYSVPLGNGTQTITASGANVNGIDYAMVSFTISINGGPVVHNLFLFPPVTEVYGLVLDAVSGVAIANASISGGGLTSEHISISLAYSSTATGTFQFALYEGSYTLSASATGYVSQKETITAQGQSDLQLTLSLAPSPPTSSTGGTNGAVSGGTLALLGGVAVVAVAAMLVARRLSASPTGRRRGAEEGS
jgi:hypothetical protein